MVFICGCAQYLKIVKRVRAYINSFKMAASVFKVKQGGGEPGVSVGTSRGFGD